MKELIKKFWPYFGYARGYKKNIITILVYIFVINLIGLVPPFITQSIFDNIIPNGDKKLLLIALIALLVAGLFLFGFGMIKDYWMTLVNQGIDFEVKMHFYYHIIRLPQMFHDATPFGDIIKRMDDCSSISNTIHKIIIEAFENSSMILIYIPAMFIINWKLSLLKLAAFPISIFISRYFAKKDMEYEKKTWEASSEVHSHLNDSFQGIRTIKSYYAEHKILRKMKKLILTNRQLGVIRKLFGYCWNFSTGFTGDIFNSLILFVAAYLMMTGKLTFGEFFAFNIISGKGIGGLSGFLNIFKDLVASLNAFTRYEQIIALPEEKYGQFWEARDFKAKGKIEFKNVWYGYDPSKPILKDLSFTVKPGQKIALVGRSGSGKTTAINLIMNFYMPQSGELLLDDKPYSQLSIRQLRNNIGVVLQDNYFFNGTILENITFGDKRFSIQNVVDACKKANAFEFVNRLPNGPYTVFGAKGINLSGGQKQRLAIARAFLRDPAILILDEATSALDMESENQIQQALEVLMHGRTTITIAHRLSTIINSDIIYMIDNGKFADIGSHSELIQKKGAYYDLYNSSGMLL